MHTMQTFITVIRVSSCLENLEISGNLTAARKVKGNILSDKTVHCLHQVRGYKYWRIS